MFISYLFLIISLVCFFGISIVAIVDMYKQDKDFKRK